MSTITPNTPIMQPRDAAVGRTSLTATPGLIARWSLAWADLSALVRPRIVTMVLFTMGVSARLTAGVHTDPWLIGHAVVGTFWVIVGAVIFNQWLEWVSDACMPRTANRPLPAGKIRPRTAVVLAALATALGLAYLAAFGTARLLGMTALSWFLYAGVYTSLKPVSVWQTPIGALSGAAPILLGAEAAGGLTDPNAWFFFAFLYLWQFPHAMAIASLYRDQFAQGNVRVAPVADPTGRTTVVMALGGAVALLGLSSVWAWTAGMPIWAAFVLIASSGVNLLFALWFARRSDEKTARILLRVTVLHLPLVCVVLLSL
ncbi:MAG: hypothetical protein Kow0040_16000 [Thermogutta sp.]